MNIHILNCVDENYVEHCGPLWLSILDHLGGDKSVKRGIQVYFHLFFDGSMDSLGLASMKKFVVNFNRKSQAEHEDGNISAQQENANLVGGCDLTVHLSLHLASEFRLSERLVTHATSHDWPDVVLARLFAGSIAPSHVERILYLDVDMAVIGDILPLYQLDMHGAVLAAVRNDCFRAQYFNSGMLLIDLVKWRAGNYENRLLEAQHQLASTLKFPDQDVLNSVFGGSKKASIGSKPTELDATSTNSVKSEQTTSSLPPPPLLLVSRRWNWFGVNDRWFQSWTVGSHRLHCQSNSCLSEAADAAFHSRRIVHFFTKWHKQWSFPYVAAYTSPGTGEHTPTWSYADMRRRVKNIATTCSLVPKLTLSRASKDFRGLLKRFMTAWFMSIDTIKSVAQDLDAEMRTIPGVMRRPYVEPASDREALHNAIISQYLDGVNGGLNPGSLWDAMYTLTRSLTCWEEVLWTSSTNQRATSATAAAGAAAATIHTTVHKNGEGDESSLPTKQPSADFLMSQWCFCTIAALMQTDNTLPSGGPTSGEFSLVSVDSSGLATLNDLHCHNHQIIVPASQIRPIFSLRASHAQAHPTVVIARRHVRRTHPPT